MRDYLFDMPAASELPEFQRLKIELREFSRLSEDLGGLISQAVAARFLGVSRASVTGMISRGRVRKIDLLGSPFIPVDDVRAYVSEKGLNKGGRGQKAGLARKAA